MCQTALISEKIVNLGTRSYKHRLESLAGIDLTNAKLGKLNRDLDKLYELLYGQFNEISLSDYKLFGSGFQKLVKSVKALYNTCKKNSVGLGISNEIELLGRNYAGLEELDEDIRNFKASVGPDSEMQSLLSHASRLMDAVI